MRDDDQQVRRERGRDGTGHEIRARRHEQTASEIERQPHAEHDRDPERIAVAQHREAEARAACDEPPRPQALARNRVRAECGGDEEDGGNVGPSVSHSTKEVAVERKEHRCRETHSRCDRTAPNARHQPDDTEAQEHADALQKAIGDAAAERNWQDRNMGERAKAESAKVEEEHFGHLGEIPAKPLPPKRRKNAAA